MSLVAYGSSDESEEEFEEVHVQHVGGEVLSLGVGRPVSADKNRPKFSPRPTKVESGPKLNPANVNVCIEEIGGVNQDDEPVHPLFRNLPKPKENVCENTGQDEIESHTDIPVLAFLPVPQSNRPSSFFPSLPDIQTDLKKKVGLGRVKITLPSLSQFTDEEELEPAKKKVKPSVKGSGLFAILPAPKNIKCRETQQPLIPHVLTKKVSQTPPPPTNHFNNVRRPTSKQACVEAEYESEDEEGKDFFSLTSVCKRSEEAVGLSTDPLLNTRSMRMPTQSLTIEEKNELVSNDDCNKGQLPIQSGPYPDSANASHLPGSSGESPYNYPESNQFYNYVEQSSQEPTLSMPSENLQLDAEAMQRLCGRRLKKNQAPVEIIDVNGTEIMPDPREWLVKQLSEEQPKMRSHSHKRNDGPTTQQRRKHQITYLAFQAKENELDLKNQWSQNRMSRKQTQSKYGF